MFGKSPEDMSKKDWMVAAGNLSLILGFKQGFATADECLMITGAPVTQENLADFNNWVEQVLAAIKLNFEREINICTTGLYCGAEVRFAEDDAAARMEQDA